MSNQPPHNPTYYDQEQPPPVGWNAGPAGYNQGAVPGYQPPPYGYGPPPLNSGYGQGGQQQPPPIFIPPPMHGGFAGHQAMADDHHDAEANLFKGSSLGFDSKTVRAGFIRKVFLLLTAMLSIVVALIALFLFVPGCKLFVRENSWLYWMSYGTFIVSYFCIICCESVRKNFPGNLICLLILTLSMGYMTAMISSFYDTNIVFIAMAICAVSCFSIILFASQVKYDFTSWIGVMFVVSIVLMLFGFSAILCAYVFKTAVVYAVYAGLAALVFMIFLAIDTQLIMGGKRYELSPEDYILGAVQLFLDIIYIFIYLLQILGFASRS